MSDISDVVVDSVSFYRCLNFVLLSSLMTYHMIFTKSNMTCVTSGSWTTRLSGTHELTPVFSGVRDARSIIFCVVFCRSLFVILRLYFWPLYNLSVFYLRLLITPWVFIFSSKKQYKSALKENKTLYRVSCTTMYIRNLQDNPPTLFCVRRRSRWQLIKTKLQAHNRISNKMFLNWNNRFRFKAFYKFA